MTNRSLLRAAVCGLVCFIAAAGCSGGAEPLAPVKGKVTYRGQPLQGGTVVFIPDTSRGTSGALAIAQIQYDGTYTLKTNDVLGATPGFHKVTIDWVLPGPRSMLPAKYRDPQLSGLSCEVFSNKANTIDLEIQ